MRYGEGQWGRVFIIRLENGEILHQSLEKFAREKNILRAALIVLGGADRGSKLVVGPEEERNKPIIPKEYVLPGVHEIVGVGTIFPNDEGDPVLHMHIASGRESSTITGCVRRGVKVWQVGEVILWEIKGTNARRLIDKDTQLELLEP